MYVFALKPISFSLVYVFLKKKKLLSYFTNIYIYIFIIEFNESVNSKNKN